MRGLIAILMLAAFAGGAAFAHHGWGSYDAANPITYVDKLKGRLMLYFGTADNNVHPSNMMQLIQALQRAGKSFELQLGPDAGHSGLNNQRMMEFFIENLVINADKPKA